MSIINGLTRAAGALRYWERRQEVVANNLANADTHGFKAQRTFARLLGDAVPVIDATPDLTAGGLTKTDNPLDLALGGDGFFVVDTPQGERLTRSGSFRLDPDGRLVDAEGNAVLGEGGPLVIPAGTVTVDAAGGVAVDGRAVGRLRVERAPAGTPLTHEGATRFLPGAGRTAVEPGERVVRQGYLETSNVSTVSSMVDLITIQRSYAAVQRTITTLDGVRQTIATELGRPG